MKNKKTATITARILEEEKDRLQDEANARGLTLTELLKEMIAKETDGSSYDKSLMAERKDIGFPKRGCPYCAIVTDWAFVKIRKISSSEDGKYCPNPDCGELVYTYSEEKGWQEQESETEELRFEISEEDRKKLQDEANARGLTLAKLLKEAITEIVIVRKLKKRESEKRESKKKESKKKEKEKEKLIGTSFNDIVTYDDEEKSKKEEEEEDDDSYLY